MKVQYLRDIKIAPCKNLGQLRHSRDLPQQRVITDFISEKNITDVFWVNDTFLVPETAHQLVVLVINPKRFISVGQVDSLIKEFSHRANEYFFVAVNKFMLYSAQEQQLFTHIADLDERLAAHWTSLVGLNLIYSSTNSNDRGQLMNFIYPVTQLLYHRYG